MIYVPEFNNNTCCYMNDSNTLRCYEYRPTYNSNVNYTDYFVNSHYLTRTGTQSFGSYNTSINCIATSNLTTAYFYRNDAVDIMLLFLLIVGFIFFFGRLFLRTFFRGFFR